MLYCQLVKWLLESDLTPVIPENQEAKELTVGVLRKSKPGSMLKSSEMSFMDELAYMIKLPTEDGSGGCIILTDRAGMIPACTLADHIHAKFGGVITVNGDLGSVSF